MFFILLAVYVLTLVFLFFYPSEQNTFLPIILSAILALNGLGMTFEDLISGSMDINTGLNIIFYTLLFIVISVATLFLSKTLFKTKIISENNLNIPSDVEDIWNSL